MEKNPKIGIYHPELPKDLNPREPFDFYGFSLPRLLFSTPKERKKLNRRIRESQSSIALIAGHHFDRYVDAIVELISELPISSIITPATKPTLEGESLKNSALRIMSSAPNTQLWISGSKSVPDPRESINPKLHSEKIRLIFDPFWYLPKSPLKAPPIFHIHGWHQERWVRKYGKTGLLFLKKMVERHHPESILFSHSQRLEEAIQFIGLTQDS